MQIFQQHKLRIVLLAALLSALSESMVSIAFRLKAAADGQAGYLSAVLIASLLPQMFFSLMGGKLADTVIRWWWWPVSLALQSLVFAAIAVAPVWPLIISGMFCVSTLTALTGPVARKLATRYSDDPKRTGSALAMIGGLAGVLGLGLGGLLVGQGITQVLLLASCGALALIACLAFLVSTKASIAVETGQTAGAFIGLRLLKSQQLLGPAGFVFLTCCGTEAIWLNGSVSQHQWNDDGVRYLQRRLAYPVRHGH